MSQRYPHAREPPAFSAVSAVSDCAAPATRGAASRMPPHMAEAHRFNYGKLNSGEIGKSQLDSGLDSGYLSSQLLSNESMNLSQRSLPPQKNHHQCPQHVQDSSSLCPKQGVTSLDSGVDLHSGVDVSAALSEDLQQLNIGDQAEMSPEERERWEEKYVATLTEAFRGDEDGDTHLHLAIIYGFREVAEMLIRLVPHPNFVSLKNSYMQTPLHLAVLTGCADLVRHLVVAGGDVSWRDRHGNTPLHLACQRADRACVRALTEPVTADEMQRAAPRYPCTPAAVTPAQLDEWNYQGLSCLHLAVMSRDLQITAHLICHGANINVTEGKAGRTPFHLAAESGDIDMLHFLVEACRVNLEALTYGGFTALQLAMMNRRYDVVELLQQLGAVASPLPDSDMDTSSDSDAEGIVRAEDVYSDIRIRGQPLVAAQ